ncbi:MAG: thioesterase family protein [Candidatus Acidiferrum sp.]
MNRFPDSASDIDAGARTYSKDVLVRFSDCDPAGIVFYPKYFEMFNNLIEDWCRDELKFTFNEIVIRRRWGLPTVHLEVDFSAPSLFGETLRAALALRSLGKSSIGVEMTLRGSDGVLRVKAKAVLVLTDRSTSRAISFPGELRERLIAFAGTTAAKTNRGDQ